MAGSSDWKQTGVAPFNIDAVADIGGSISGIHSFGAAPGTLTASVMIGGVTTDQLGTALNAWVLAAWTPDCGLYGWLTAAASHPALINEAPHKLTYLAGPGGGILGHALQIVVPSASSEPVTAHADGGATFAEWSDSRTNNPRSDHGLNADLTLTASFRSTGGVPISWFNDHGFTLAEGEDWSDLDARDPHAKGMSLLEEFVAMTDPADPNSRFRADIHQFGSPNIINVEPNSPERVYSLFYSTTLKEGEWLPVPGQQTIPGGAPLQDTRQPPVFYRVKVALPD